MVLKSEKVKLFLCLLLHVALCETSCATFPNWVKVVLAGTDLQRTDVQEREGLLHITDSYTVSA